MRIGFTVEQESWTKQEQVYTRPNQKEEGWVEMQKDPPVKKEGHVDETGTKGAGRRGGRVRLRRGAVEKSDRGFFHTFGGKRDRRLDGGNSAAKSIQKRGTCTLMQGATYQSGK